MITVDVKRLDIKPGSRILDIGCGEGRHTVMAARHPATKCVGADYGFGNLETTRDKLKYHESLADLSCHTWDLTCSNITALNFKDRAFDGIICSEVLEHIIEDDAAIRELIRVLKPGGFLAVSVPRFWPEKICWWLSKEYSSASQGHVRIYRKKTVIDKITSCGTRLDDCHHAHSIHAVFWWLKCLFGPDRDDVHIVNLYHRMLVWDLMKKPGLTRWIDGLLNPLMGKSLVMYFTKPG